MDGDGESSQHTTFTEAEDAETKREWLLQRRCDHEAAMAQRQTTDPHPAPLVNPSLLSTPTERELYLRSLREQRNTLRCSPIDPHPAPLVDPSLLSTPTERELYLRSLHATKHSCARERRRCNTDAMLRPSVSDLWKDDCEPQQQQPQQQPQQLPQPQPLAQQEQLQPEPQQQRQIQQQPAEEDDDGDELVQESLSYDVAAEDVHVDDVHVDEHEWEQPRQDAPSHEAHVVAQGRRLGVPGCGVGCDSERFALIAYGDEDGDEDECITHCCWDGDEPYYPHCTSSGSTSTASWSCSTSTISAEQIEAEALEDLEAIEALRLEVSVERSNTPQHPAHPHAPLHTRPSTPRPPKPTTPHPAPPHPAPAPGPYTCKPAPCFGSYL